jgi:hypothetical protein
MDNLDRVIKIDLVLFSIECVSLNNFTHIKSGQYHRNSKHSVAECLIVSFFFLESEQLSILCVCL